MSTKTIVRIEHSSGLGIWQSNAYLNLSNVDSFVYRHKAFPSPKYDTPYLDRYKEDKEWFCAFKTVDQMSEWLTKEEVKEFIELDCSVICLEVSEWQEGKYQVLYTKESIVKCTNISDLFRN